MQVIPEFERLSEWEEMAKQVVDKYPERFSHVDVSKIIAYFITNKPETKNVRPYEMQTDKLPMRMTNPHEYFVWFKHQSEWFDRPKNIKAALVVSALERIDPDNPYIVSPLDYRDQTSMVRTFGIDWFLNPDIPNVLEEEIQFKD